MRRRLLVKIAQLCVANLANTQSTRSAHGLGPAHGASFKRPVACDWRFDLSDFNFAFAWRMKN
jgi:hypothetical protein